VDITFDNNKIKKTCQKPIRKLKTRLDDIRAATNMAVLQLLPGRCHALTADKKGLWAIDLEHPNRLIFEPVLQNPDDRTVDGRLILENIVAIKLIKVEDYHGK